MGLSVGLGNDALA